MIFKSIDKSSYDIIQPFITKCGYGRCDYTFGTLFMYSEMMKYSYAVENDILYVKGEVEDGEIYLAPICDGEEKFREGIKNLLLEKETGKPLRILSCPDDKLFLLSGFEYEIKEGYGDYVYDISVFATLSGKKYHSKRNHISRFQKDNPDYSFEEISLTNMGEVIDFFHYFVNSQQKDSSFFRYELKAAGRLLENYFNISMHGYLLRVRGRVVGFTVGEIVNDMLIVHLEKCDKSLSGIYEKIANSFTRKMLEKYPHLKLLNREDDAGDEGLKKAKLSYHPTYIADKKEIIFH